MMIKKIISFLCCIMIVFQCVGCRVNDDYIAPITMDECGQIFYANEDDFVCVKDYLFKLYNEKENLESSEIYDICFSLNDEEIPMYIKDLDIQNKCKNLMSSKVRTIEVFSYEENKVCILFFIDGTDSTRYGIIWKNYNDKFATAENLLIENWCAYYIGYT